MSDENSIYATDIVYPVPLSSGDIVTITNVPYYFSKADADKLCRTFLALVTEPHELEDNTL